MTPEEHARRAEDLVGRARSASMAGWSRRGRRREMYAEALIHATLATVRRAEPDRHEQETS